MMSVRVSTMTGIIDELVAGQRPLGIRRHHAPGLMLLAELQPEGRGQAGQEEEGDDLEPHDQLERELDERAHVDLLKDATAWVSNVLSGVRRVKCRSGSPQGSEGRVAMAWQQATAYCPGRGTPGSVGGRAPVWTEPEAFPRAVSLP